MDCFPADAKSAKAFDLQKFSSLEDEFRDMPEYYQVLFAFEPLTPANKKLDHVKRAYALFPQDPVTIYLYGKESASTARAKWQSQVQTAEVWRARREAFQTSATLMRQAGNRQDNGFYFYMAGSLMAEIGDFGETTKLLKLGNEAKLNFQVEPFPFTFFHANIAEIDKRYDLNRRFSLKMASLQTPTENYIRLKDMIREYQVIISLSGNVELLDTLHQFSCRYGEQAYAPLIHQLVAVVLVGMVSGIYEELGPQTLTIKQHKGLLQLDRYRQEIIGLVKGYSAYTQWEMDEFYERTGASREYPLFTQDVEFTPEMMQMSLRYELFTRLEIQPRISGIFKRMEGFNYADTAAFARD